MPISESICWQYGLCVCTGDGKLTRLFWERLRVVIFQCFRPGSECRQLLGSSCIGYLFVGSEVAADGALVAGAGVGDHEHGVGYAIGSSQLFVHVSLHYFKPFRPTFQLMDIVSQDGGAIKCRAKLDWKRLWSVLASLDKAKSWRWKPHPLLDTMQPIADFEPALVDYEEFTAGEVAFVPSWMGPPDCERARAK